MSMFCQEKLIKALAVLSVLSLTVTLTAENVYAQTASLSASTIAQGTPSIQVTGSASGGVLVQLIEAAAVPCAGLVLFQDIGFPPSFSVTLPTGSLTPGEYCVRVFSTSIFYLFFAVFPAPATITITVTAQCVPCVAEYPLGLPILFILMVVAYGAIRRKSRSKNR